MVLNFETSSPPPPPISLTIPHDLDIPFVRSVGTGSLRLRVVGEPTAEYDGEALVSFTADFREASSSQQQQQQQQQTREVRL